jgi:hypothetical protein
VSTQKKSSNDEQGTGGLSFILNHNKSVDVSCYIPETDNMSNDELTSSAENYANLLLYINEGLLMPDIIKFIQKRIDNTDNIQDKLFLENVLVFWGLLHIEHQKKTRHKPNQPVIRPLSAFRTTE